MAEDSLSSDLTENKTISAESVVVQAIQEVPDAVERHVRGDQSAFAQVQERAEAIAKGQVSDAELRNALASKFGDGV